MNKKMILIIAVLSILVFMGVSHAADEDLWTITNPPDVLIVLDLSGSMDWPPQDTAANYYVTTGTSCNSGSDGPYYMTSGTGHTRACLSTDRILYVSGATCNINGPFYIKSTPEHNRACTQASGWGGSASATSYGKTVPSYSDSSCGEPFYRTSGTGHTTECDNTFSNNVSPEWSPSDCAEPFYKTYHADHSVRCKKIDIAKYALFSILNDSNTDGLNKINAADVTSLGVRMGLMKFYDCGSSSASRPYTQSNACIKLAWPITSDAYTTTTPFASIYCNNSDCSAPATDGTNTCGTLESTSSTSPTHECVVGFDDNGGTPLQYALQQAKSYLDNHKANDPAAACRNKSVIFITDGADTLACNGSGSSTGQSQRRAPVFAAKSLKTAGYDVYVIGFGANMPIDLQNTLNWAAFYGGTRNPNVTQTGTTTAVSVGTNPCSNGTDPGPNYLAGYAFMATNPTELASAIRSAITSILTGTYSFSSQAAVAAARVQGENYLYEASFEPRNNTGANREPFWPGHLKKYRLNENTGALITPACWDAGAKLAAQGSRNMWTYKGSMTAYTTAAVFDADLNVSPLSTDNCGPRCQEIVGFYRGDAAYNIEENNWKLGDLFHTNPIIVKTPSTFFYDPRQCGATSFAAFRDNNQRTISNGNQLILAGANDGQLHAFKAGTSSADCTTGGNEVWSFIPPNLLEKMGPIAHNSHADRATLAAHDSFVDGPLQVADAWVPSAAGIGTSKSTSDWKTLAVFGLGGGGGNFLWSSCSSCYCPYNPSYPSAVRYSPTYTATTPYYCGYYALDVTDSVTSSQPTLMWHLNPNADQALYLGEPWSKMQIGRVKIAGNEKWVGFIGGGYSGSACLSADGGTSYACNTPATYSAGKGFYVVDLSNGNIIWKYTHAENGNMDFSAPASPAAIDADSDGFIDTVYMGDLGGNMWRFRLCPSDSSACGLATYPSSCTTGNWSGSRLYAASNVERGSGLATPVNTHKQIFTRAVVAKDSSGYVWVYWGTGENNDPTIKPTDTSDTKNRIYAVKENKTFTGTYTTSNLKDITSTVYCYSATTTGCTVADTENGWYINLSTNTLTIPGLPDADPPVAAQTISNPVGEKMISDPALFGGMLQFPTYVPQQGAATACGQAGNAFVYRLDYLTGAGMASGSGRTDYVGVGIGSAILVSYRPGYGAADSYGTASGGAGTSTLTQQLGEAPSTSSMTNILYWKDRRLQ